MASTPHLSFGTFRLDPTTTCLWHDDQLVSLPPKPFAVLAYLVTHAGDVVSKEDLLDAVWPETAVSEGVLKTCMGQIRKVLGETARKPQYIATVHRRGYRFIAPVTVLGQSDVAPLSPPPASSNARHVVGREAELVQLHQLWGQALQGERQLVFVTGEAGIGKTTLVDALVTQVEASAAVWTGRGQCIEQYGSGEAYLPLLEAVGQLARGPDGARLLEILRQQAPSWLLQMPALVSEAEYQALRQRSSPVTRDRMLRELAEAVEALTTVRPLLLVLEDLHWSDGATLDWLTFIAHRRVTARLFIVGTYRPADAVMRAHPVRMVSQELQRQEQATELHLPYLTETGVARYLAQRFGEGQLPEELPRVLYKRTSGNPFFLITMVDELIRGGFLESQGAGWTLKGTLTDVTQEVPESVRHLIDSQLEHSSPEVQAALAAASIVGSEFSAAAVAVCLDQASDEVETNFDVLARHGQFVRVQGVAEWPDGTVATRYGFIHDLYREIIYNQIPMTRRVRWHAQIGIRLETGYGERTQEVAAELASHFVRGRDAARAVHYFRVAGAQAIQRSAHGEAISHLTKGLELLKTLPDNAERVQNEIVLQNTLGLALMATQGWGTPEVERVYARVHKLCGQAEEAQELLPVLWGLGRYYSNQALPQTALQVGKQLLTLAERLNNPTFCLGAHMMLGGALTQMGAFVLAWEHVERCRQLSTPEHDRILTLRYGISSAVQRLYRAAHVLWLLGYPDQALCKGREAQRLAQKLSHPLSLAYAQSHVGRLYRLRGDVHAAYKLAETAVNYATDQGFHLLAALGTLLRGWALVEQGHNTAGLEQMRQGFTDAHVRGGRQFRVTRLPLLAEVYGKTGQLNEALNLLSETLETIHAVGFRGMEAETLCLKGELLLKQPVRDEQQVESCLNQALAVARSQQAKSWELRAATSLARLWQSQGKRQDAYDILVPVYEWFIEGFDTADLQEAKSLLEELR